MTSPKNGFSSAILKTAFIKGLIRTTGDYAGQVLPFMMRAFFPTMGSSIAVEKIFPEICSQGTLCAHSSEFAVQVALTGASFLAVLMLQDLCFHAAKKWGLPMLIMLTNPVMDHAALLARMHTVKEESEYTCLVLGHDDPLLPKNAPLGLENPRLVIRV